VVYQTTFQSHIYSAIFVPKITGNGQLLLKLSLVVSFFETQCRNLKCILVMTLNVYRGNSNMQIPLWTMNWTLTLLR